MKERNSINYEIKWNKQYRNMYGYDRILIILNETIGDKQTMKGIKLELMRIGF